MNLLNIFMTYIKETLNLVESALFLFTLFVLLIIINFILYFIKNKKHIKKLQELKSPDIFNYEDLKKFPLINIIIPAWDEGEEFRDCLESITKLTYPQIKVVVNGGGKEETIKIMDSFKKFNNFLILRQISGDKRAEFGKIKAINECLDHVSEGIVYLIDADCYLTDEILLRMIQPIINFNEDITVSTFRPLIYQENNDFVNYLQISRVSPYKGKIERYNRFYISGANTCMKYEVIKQIGKFSEDQVIATEISMGNDLLNKGFKIYNLFDYKSRIYSAYPNSIYEYSNQKKRYFENSLLYSYKNKNLRYLITFFGIIFFSIYLLILPIFLIFSFGLFLLGILIFLHLYLIRVRKYLFFKKIVYKNNIPKFRKILFLKMLIYIYVDIFINILTLLDLFFYIKKIKEL